MELEGRQPQRGAPSTAYLDSSCYYSTTKAESRVKKEMWNWEQWEDSGPVERKVMVDQGLIPDCPKHPDDGVRPLSVLQRYCAP